MAKSVVREKPSSQRIEDCPEFAAATARLEGIHREREVCYRDVQRLAAEVSAGRGPDSIVSRARALVSGQWKPPQISDLSSKQRELEARNEDLQVFDKALELQTADLGDVRRRCGAVVRDALMPEYGQLLLAHVEAVLQANRTAVAVYAFRNAQPRDVSMPYCEFPPVAGPDLGLNDSRDPNSDINCWLRLLVAQGLLTGQEPALRDTPVAARR